MKPQKFTGKIVAVLIGLLSVTTLKADDIEVYGAHAGENAAPNVLFIIDISGSMREGTDGSLPPAAGEKAKKYILNGVMSKVLEASAGKINAGLILFNRVTTGVKWPVTDLTGLASAIDSDLPADMTNEDVLRSLINNSGEWDETNYVSPLTEAIQYFSGEEVWYNNEQWAGSLYPPEWVPEVNRYSIEWPMFWTPIPGSYMPQDAFKPGSSATDPAIGLCRDGDYYADDIWSCTNANREVVPGSCEDIPPSTETTCEPQVCAEYGEGGDCIRVVCTGEDVTYEEPGYSECEYYIGSWETPNYITPIGAACQSNYIILLSDGLPTKIPVSPEKPLEILGLPDMDSCENMGAMFFGDSTNRYGDCAAELVEYMATNDMVSGISPSKVNTYTIGFGLTGENAEKGTAFLTHLANKGGGEFFAADSYESLLSSLTTIIDNISGETDDFTGISVGVRNLSFSNDNRAFINIFKPSAKRSWPGNMKGYFLSSDGLLDVRGHAVVDENGLIKPGSHSFWSKTPDGSVVTQGGLVESIASGPRNLYTYTGAVAPFNVNLSDTSGQYKLDASNPLVTNQMLGVTDDSDREQILEWVKTAPVSDPLHTKPVIVKYSSGEVVFTMTNQGFIHAVDAENPRELNDKTGGDELYAFIPPELLPNLQQIKRNLSTGPHIYGLDGQITFHHEDSNQDGVINSDETARLYFGMRRGGNSYYALDISDKTEPRLLWQIKGGEGAFSALGQSWSRMILTKLKVSGLDKTVLIFGGGYDVAEDARSQRSQGVGNRVFVVDANTGEHLWSVGAGAPGLDAGEMIYSIPTDIAAVDLNGNGYTDHLYFGDMGGQLWRVKFHEALDVEGAPSNNFSSDASVQRIGDFGVSANRKFFYPPSVALMSFRGENHLALSIGSGNRAKPLSETVQDMIFMIKDPIDTPLTSTLLLSDLYDATENLVSEGTDRAAQRELMNTADGWYVKLAPAEKSLSRVIVYDKKLRFTTYEPTEVVSQACSASSSSKGRYYVMNLHDATPSSDEVVDESQLTKNDRATEIVVQGIPSEPNIIFPPDGSTIEVFIGKENISTVMQDVKRLYWKQINAGE